VNAFSRAHWQGGGHINAAGGISMDSMTQTLERFRALVIEYQQQITQS
jgi:phosphoesterase RecJ-like protein